MNISQSPLSTRLQHPRPLAGRDPGPGDTPDLDIVSLGSSQGRSEVSSQQLLHLFRNREVQQSQQTQQGEEITSLYPGREGYDVNFLGRTLPLPALDASIKDKAAPLLNSPDQSELKYTNFSIVMNKERRQAFYSVVNIDGGQSEDRPRDGKWAIDGRISRDHQLGNEAYSNNPIDRGHLVRRRDPIWGPKADQANQDTFAYTNAGLQHGNLNQKTWLDLENHIRDQAISKQMKLTVMTGPVFDDSDPSFDNRGRISPKTQIPQEFWKVVVWNDPQEGLKGSAFLQSQKDYVGRKIFQSSFESENMSVYQIPLEELERKTNLSFGELMDTTKAASRVVDASEVVVGA